AEAWSDWYHNNKITFKLIQPLIVKMNRATQEELDQLYQQALVEMNSPDLCAIWYFLSVWGTKPFSGA
nr:hypothetical protein [Ktedonobacteraceae bacterium]